jgi:hypothetical protein
VRTGSLSNARGVQLIDVPAGNTRFVRLDYRQRPERQPEPDEEAWLGGNYA